MPVREAGTIDWQIVKPLHRLRMNVIGPALESVPSQLKVTGLLLRRPVTRRSVQVHLVFGVLALQVEGWRDQDQSRCPGDSILSFAGSRRLRQPEHAPKQRSRWRQNPARENSQRSKSARTSLALSLLSKRIRSSNRLQKLNQPVEQL